MTIPVGSSLFAQQCFSAHNFQPRDGFTMESIAGVPLDFRSPGALNGRAKISAQASFSKTGRFAYCRSWPPIRGPYFPDPLLTASGDNGANHPQQSGSRVPQSLKGLPPSDLTEDEAIAHALNRLGYGPRPGDVETVRQMGVAKWIDRQLHPESIDDSALQARLSRFPTLSMSSQALWDQFPRPKAAAKREGVTPQQYKQQQQAKLQAARQATDGQEQMAATNSDAQANGNSAQAGDNGSAASVAPQNMTPDELAEILLPGAKNAAKGGGNPLLNYEQIKTPQRIIAELAMAKIDRAVYSEKQLYEEMVDFWFNHFNVFAGKGWTAGC